MVIVLSCKQIKSTPITSFENDDVYLKCPEGWSITEKDNLDGKGYYLSIEKDGFVSSGVMTVSWLYNDMAPENLMTIYQNDMTNNVIYKNADLVFENIVEDENENYKTISSKYTFGLTGLNHHGIISAFNYQGSTFIILKQGAIEDYPENKKGFEAIENSFKIKNVN